jgi:hypothetical protein
MMLLLNLSKDLLLHVRTFLGNVSDCLCITTKSQVDFDEWGIYRESSIKDVDKDWISMLDICKEFRQLKKETRFIIFQQGDVNIESKTAQKRIKSFVNDVQKQVIISFLLDTPKRRGEMFVGPLKSSPVTRYFGNVLSVSLINSSLIEDVSALSSVKYLSLAQCKNVKDVSMLGNCYSLDLEGCELIGDVSSLGKVAYLSILDCAGINKGFDALTLNTFLSLNYSSIDFDDSTESPSCTLFHSIPKIHYSSYNCKDPEHDDDDDYDVLYPLFQKTTDLSLTWFSLKANYDFSKFTNLLRLSLYSIRRGTGSFYVFLLLLYQSFLRLFFVFFPLPPSRFLHISCF